MHRLATAAEAVAFLAKLSCLSLVIFWALGLATTGLLLNVYVYTTRRVNWRPERPCRAAVSEAPPRSQPETILAMRRSWLPERTHYSRSVYFEPDGAGASGVASFVQWHQTDRGVFHSPETASFLTAGETVRAA